jgi:hypothetical protein
MLFLINLDSIGVRLPEVSQSSILVSALLLPLLVGIPGRGLLIGHERDTQALSAWVRSRTDSQCIVVSDYAELNFHAGRKSIYSQAVISHNWALTGLTTSDMLIHQMEVHNACMVLLHEEGGEVPPQHLYYLPDYDKFHAYLNQNYEVVRNWDRAGQLIRIWER